MLSPPFYLTVALLFIQTIGENMTSKHSRDTEFKREPDDEVTPSPRLEWERRAAEWR